MILHRKSQALVGRQFRVHLMMKMVKCYEAAQPQKNVDKILVDAKSVEFEPTEWLDDRDPDKVKGSSDECVLESSLFR